MVLSLIPSVWTRATPAPALRWRLVKPAASISFFGEGGLLARVLPDYEERPAQRRFSEAVGSVLRDGGLLLAEAGTGTGKTLAYLLPAVELGRRGVGSPRGQKPPEQPRHQGPPPPGPGPGPGPPAGGP